MTFGVEYAHAEPYRQLNGGPARPYLVVRLQFGERTIDTIGLIDSGADGSLFNAQFAQYLGFTLDPDASATSQGLGGTVPTWQFDIELTVLGKRFPASVAFSESWTPAFGLLGRGDFSRAFRVGIDERHRRSLLAPDTGWPQVRRARTEAGGSPLT